jgi:hypothetical protein
MATKQELSQLRFIASSSRALVREKHSTPLSAVDTLQKLAKRWKWLWLAVACMDGWDGITAHMPLAEALAQIESHGGPAGIVGAVMIDRQFHFLRKPLAKGVKAILDTSTRNAENRAMEAVIRSVEDVFRAGGLEVVEEKSRSKQK